MDNKKISEVFLEISEAIESGKFGKKVKIGLTTLGSEHGVENMKKAIELADSDLFEVVVIGERVDDEHETYEVDNDEDMYKKMEELLDSGEIQACVTLHYNFPIGVSTVGRVYTPGHGKEMFLATTTGTSDTERTKAMVRNAVAGIIAAKSCGIAKPTVGILNIDGARQVEKALKHFKDNGFDIEFAESQRADGGIVMRGNDLLMGSCDVMVTDSLTGNLLMKMFGSFTSGGNYETTGFGYGPGIGEGYERNIFIVSRGIDNNKKSIYKQAHKADFNGILESLSKKEAPKASSEEVKMPDKEVVSATISGIDILEIEDAVQALWKENIYAESGMGCTGPIVQVSDANLDKASQILKQNGYIE